MTQQQHKQARSLSAVPSALWIEHELAGCQFKDERLTKRFRLLINQLCEGTAESIPLACQDWASTKAAYRFLSNDRVSEEQILAGHFNGTRERFTATEGPIFVLHDTSMFSYKREDGRAVGLLTKSCTGHFKDTGRPKHHTACGILMHSSLAVTAEGLPLGLAAIKFWAREEFKGCNGLKKHINPTRVPIEEKESIRWLKNLEQSTALLGVPDRCVHIGDREADIFELFWAAHQAGTHFLVRTCVDRCAGDGTALVEETMHESPCKGSHRIEVRDPKGNMREATLQLKYRRVRVLPSQSKQRRYSPLTLTVLHATEQGAPKGVKPINWKLMTDLPVRWCAQAREKLTWYAMRWKIEVFHKILKSGCKVEESKLRSAERLVNLLAIFCILAWRIFWMTLLNRTARNASSRLALTSVETELLDRMVKDKDPSDRRHKTLPHYLTKIARLGGYLARANDPPPGNKVMWRGLSRLMDIELGFLIGAKNCG